MTEKDLVLKTIDESGVRAGQVWQHYKGGRYTIVAMAIDEATLSAAVVYAGHDGIVWTRRLAHFMMFVEGTNTPRFIKVDDEAAQTKPFTKEASWRPTDGSAEVSP